MIDRTRAALLILISAVAAGELYVAFTYFNSEALPQTCAEVPPSLNLEPISLSPPLSKGEKAPNFTLTDIDDNTFSLTDLQEKIVVLNFMATWCQSCIWEMSDLIELHNTYSNKNVVFLSVAIEPVGTVQDVIEFKSKYCAEWTYVLDDGSLFSSYKVQVLPTTYVIDGSGSIMYGRVGVVDRQEISNILNELA